MSSPGVRAVQFSLIKVGSNAEKSGLKPGDVLLTYDGRRLVDNGTLIKVTQSTEGRLQPVSLKVSREGALLETEVQPGALGVVTEEIAFDWGQFPELVNEAQTPPPIRTLAPAPPQAGPAVTTVAISNVSMPFSSMVVFMVKWALASIPAFIILFLIFFVLLAIFGALFGIGNHR